MNNRSGNSVEEIISRDNGLYSQYLIAKVNHFMERVRQKELSPYHIAPRQGYILFVLQSLNHKATLAELAEYCDRRVNNMSIQMARMEKKGLVKKIREVPGSTLLKFELTEKGITALKNDKMKVEKAIMSILSEEEYRQLIPILKKILNEAEKKAA
jgi:DNA-binding MarR family transcriptional regulator